MPVPVAPTGYPLAQALVYYPDDYFLAKNANKRYPLYLFLHGAGEGRFKDIGEVLNTSLPQLIAQGLKPYGIDTLTGDTIKFIVVSPHCASCGGSYSYPQLQYTIPYLVANYRIDSTCMWAGGLSSGGRGTFSLPMGNVVGDTLLGNKLAGIMPMANGGYDNRTDLFPNLATAMKSGLSVLYTIGDQDPGYNATGFFQYDALMSKNAQPGKYNVKVIVGGTHSTNVWNPPFPETGRIWSAKYNAWTQMWYLRRKPAIKISPVVSVPHAVATLDSTLIHWPNTRVYLGDSSYVTNGSLANIQWAQPAGPNVAIWTSLPGRGMVLSGLVPGVYQVKLYAVDSATLVMDTAIKYFQVLGPPPVICPVCPVCPPIRKAIGFTIDAITGAFKFTYDDGNP
jgi:hypothetical protein